MRYWWVNQNQTYRHEVRGGYLWSPKRKTNLAANPFYDFMREVAPGDVVFSFADTLIRAIGIAASHAYEAPKPLEFGQAGAYWDKIGWRLAMRLSELRLPIKPSAHMDALKPLLPDRYAPLRANGAGLQNVYLTRVPDRRKRSANPSFVSALKLRTLRLGNQRDGRGEHGSTADGALPGAGGGVSGLGSEGEGMGRGERRFDALAGELVRAFATLAGAA